MSALTTVGGAFKRPLLFLLLTESLCPGCDGGRMGRPPVMSIWTAVEREDLQAIQDYADNDGDLEVGSTLRGKTPLLYALQLHKKAGFAKLLEVGASANTLCRGGGVVIQEAARESDLYWLRAALESGGDANLFNHLARGYARTTPLVTAIGARSIDNVKLLCAHGADVDVVDEYGRSALTTACDLAEFEIVHHLLTSGADYNSPARAGFTFLDSLKQKKPESYPASAKDAAKWCRAVRDWLKKRGVDPDKATWEGTKWRFD